MNDFRPLSNSKFLPKCSHGHEGGPCEIPWVYQDCNKSPSVLGSFGAVFPGHRESARVVPHPAPCELSSRHKTGNFGANFGAVLGADLGPARPAGSSSRGPKPDIDCYYNHDMTVRNTEPFEPASTTFARSSAYVPTEGSILSLAVHGMRKRRLQPSWQ